MYESKSEEFTIFTAKTYLVETTFKYRGVHFTDSLPWTEYFENMFTYLLCLMTSLPSRYQQSIAVTLLRKQFITMLLSCQPYCFSVINGDLLCQSSLDR